MYFECVVEKSRLQKMSLLGKKGLTEFIWEVRKKEDTIMRFFRYIFGYIYGYGDNEREDKIVDKKWSIPMGMWDGESDEDGRPFSAGGVLLYIPPWYAQYFYRKFHKKDRRKTIK